MLHHQELDPHLHQLLEQLLRDVADRAQQCAERGDCQLDRRHKHDDPERRQHGRVVEADVELRPIRRVLGVDLDGVDDGVDQELGGVGGGRRHDAGQRRDREEGDGQARAGLPDQRDDPRQRGRGAGGGAAHLSPALAPVLGRFGRRLDQLRSAGQTAGCRLAFDLPAPAVPEHHHPLIPRSGPVNSWLLRHGQISCKY